MMFFTKAYTIIQVITLAFTPETPIYYMVGIFGMFLADNTLVIVSAKDLVPELFAGEKHL
jgi:hypothetical protein